MPSSSSEPNARASANAQSSGLRSLRSCAPVSNSAAILGWTVEVVRARASAASAICRSVVFGDAGLDGGVRVVRRQPLPVAVEAAHAASRRRARLAPRPSASCSLASNFS